MRILVVEDDLLVAGMLRNFLGTRGHQVLLAGTGEEGFRAAIEEPLDAVFLDVVLPGLSGIGLLERLGQHRRSLPVVLISGQATEEEARAGLRLGAFDYLSKPFNLDQLDIVLQALDVAQLSERTQSPRPCS